jgi:hypothetical protein
MQSTIDVKIEAPEIVRHALPLVWSSVTAIWSRDRTRMDLDPVPDVLGVLVPNPFFMYLSLSGTGAGCSISYGASTGYFFYEEGREPKPSLPLTGKKDADFRQPDLTLRYPSAQIGYFSCKANKQRIPLGQARLAGLITGLTGFDRLTGLLTLTDGQDRSGGLAGLQEARP